VAEKFDVSIIIVSYNCLNILDDCLKSLFFHTKDISFEIIVVDNNSTEGSVDAIIKKYPEVKLIKNDTNRGFSAANNQGISVANGKYFLFLNNDTVLLENTIKAVYNFSERMNEDVIVGCKLLNSDKSLQASIDCFPTVWNTFTENFFLYKLFPKSGFFNKYYINYQFSETPCIVDVVKGAFLFASAKIIKKYNGFDERFFFYAEETDLCYRFSKDGGKVYFYPETAIIHLGGATTDKYQWFKFKNQTIAATQFFQKHFTGLKYFSVILIRYAGLTVRIPLYFIMGCLLLNKNLFLKSYYYFRQLFIYPKNLFN
jgi:GT2 family glycosyltransferase